MAIIPTPSRGQPLDVDYIGQIATQVNQLTTLVGDTSTAYSTINDTSIKTSDLKIFAQTVNVVASTTNTSGATQDFTINYPTFKGFPIITATIVSGASSNIGDDATVVFKNVGSQQATMRIKYRRNGNLNINVNVIAIGFPESA